MGLDAQTYWLTDRQSQCDFDFDSYLKIYFSETVIITVLKSVARKRVVKTKDFYVNCVYCDIWSV
jgi:hypothetical protein